MSGETLLPERAATKYSQLVPKVITFRSETACCGNPLKPFILNNIMETLLSLRYHSGIGKIKWILQWAIRMLSFGSILKRRQRLNGGWCTLQNVCLRYSPAY
jgi:hypothetical protein